MIVDENDTSMTEPDEDQTTTQAFPDSIEERHAMFLTAFEKHMVHDDWPQLVKEELGWTQNQVDVHSYQYLAALAECDDEDTDKTPSKKKVKHRSAESSPNDVIVLEVEPAPWSGPEKSYLELLLLREQSNGESSAVYSWQERIAHDLPWRSQQEVDKELDAITKKAGRIGTDLLRSAAARKASFNPPEKKVLN